MAMMNAHEIQEHAKESGFDSMEFLMMGANIRPVNGKFLDAYFGMIQIPEIGEGFITIDQLIKEFGFDNLRFFPIGDNK